jgi:hypothetical protein
MTESVSFWLDNKKSTGAKTAVVGDQMLVLYRDRYYVVTDGAALAKGGKSLRYSLSSLPVVWKKALKGDVRPPVKIPAETDSELTAQPVKRERKKVENPAMTEIQQESAPENSEKTPQLKVKAPRKTEAKPPPQPPVAANCPYCNTRHEIPMEKGKNGKSFFMACSKCQGEFAVRFVPVTIYQAQVAGFR